MAHVLPELPLSGRCNDCADLPAGSRLRHHGPRAASEQLDRWLTDVEATGVPEMRAFARGLRKDYAVVKAGLTLAYSNGQTEAQVQRLKLLKRAMFGQAGFDLLRQRVLHREPPLPIKRRTSKSTQLLAA
ncbi:MAG TPA: transposase [Herpetosiphonaceae bacterium]|nr:transposase [Herpetosiphonaceae bacterium]